jgi:hypothetical protein
MEFDLYPVIKGHGLSLNPFGAIALANPAAFRIGGSKTFELGAQIRTTKFIWNSLSHCESARILD